MLIEVVAELQTESPRVVDLCRGSTVKSQIFGQRVLGREEHFPLFTPERTVRRGVIGLL